MGRNGRSLDYLGYCFTPGNVRMRKSIKKNFARKAKRIKNKKRRKEVLASYWGWCKWGDCRHLWKTITNNDMSFGEHGITGRSTTKDGKRFFDIRQVKAMEILNMPITILDFEPGVMTSHGGGRYSVKILCGGKEVKMITNSFTLKSQLDQAREMGLFPIETRLIRRDTGGNMTDYVFE